DQRLDFLDLAKFRLAKDVARPLPVELGGPVRQGPPERRAESAGSPRAGAGGGGGREGVSPAPPPPSPPPPPPPRPTAPPPATSASSSAESAPTSAGVNDCGTSTKRWMIWPPSSTTTSRSWSGAI